MSKDSTFTRHGIGIISKKKELVAAKRRRLACHLQARPLLRSIGYKRFKLETSAPGLSRLLGTSKPFSLRIRDSASTNIGKYVCPESRQTCMQVAQVPHA